MYVCMYVACTYIYLHGVQHILLFSQDKVANFWCSLSVLIKLKNIFSVPVLAQIRFVRYLSVCLSISLNSSTHTVY